MKTLSIRQPWAWLIVRGFKDIENRDWQTKHRGPVLIHASKRYDHDGARWVKKNFPDIKIASWAEKEVGGIVGYANVSDCTAKYNSRWFFGEYGFVLNHAQALPFTPMKGRLNIFDCLLTPGQVEVVDVRSMRGDDRNYVDYIGRNFAGWDEAPLRNRSGGVGEYRKWLWGIIRGADSPAYGQLINIAARAAIGENIRLGCWCKSKGADTPCHGDVVRAAIEWILGERIKREEKSAEQAPLFEMPRRAAYV